MRRNAGRNIAKSGPVSRPLPDLGKYAYEWEKDLLKDNERRQEYDRGFDQGVCTALATTFRILLFHYRELKPLKHRLQLYSLYFEKFMDTITKPDEEQRFAEWYYEKTVGLEFLRKENETMNQREEKKLVGEFVDSYIQKCGKTKKEVAAAININPTPLNALRAGRVSKKVIDAIMKYLGIEFTPGELAHYKEAYGVGNNENARFAQMEEELIQREELRQETEAEQSEPEHRPIPVDEGFEEIVEQVVNHEPAVEEEELPFKDVNPMYREAQEDDSPEPVKKVRKLIHPDELMESIECYITKIDDFKITLKAIKEEARKLEKFIKMLELLNEK